MNVADIMTRDPATVQAEAPLAEAVQLMLEKRISGLPVLDAHRRVVGMLTEGDLLQRAETGTDTRAS